MQTNRQDEEQADVTEGSETDVAESAEADVTESADKAFAQFLDAARRFARFTGFPVVHGAHVALALLSSEESFLDVILKQCFNGLRAATVCDSLLGILKSEAESAPPAELPEAPPLSDDADFVMRRASGLAAESRLHPEAAVAAALFERPGPLLCEAFKDAGVNSVALKKLSVHIAEQAAQPAADGEAPRAFVDGGVDLKAFGPVARGALSMLARIGAAYPERKLRDVDLLHCLINQGDSLLVEALHVGASDVRSVRGQLEAMVGRAASDHPASEIGQAQMSRLLAGVFNHAQSLAAEEGCELISESHLVRAHLNRVAASTPNVYEKLGVNTVGLQRYLARQTADRAVVEPPTPPGWIEDIEGYLRERVINQEQAVSAVVPALKAMRSGLSEPGRLLGTFLFLGPTGVGKTELARAIGDIAFEPKPGVREPYLIRLDCGRLARREDVVQLLGAAQGLVGYKEGRLTNGLRDKPQAVILFDEAEKAHKDIWQSLLTFFDEGIVHEADGTEYDATGCVLVATSNLGYSCFGKPSCVSTANGGQCQSVKSRADSLQDFIWSCVKEYFSPEFLGRYGRENVIFFNDFDLPSYVAIVRSQVRRLTEEMSGRGFEVEVNSPAVFDYLAREAWQQRQDGARPVRRLIVQHLRQQIISAREHNPRRTTFSFTFMEGSGRIVLED